MKRTLIVFIISLTLSVVMAASLYADKSSVKIRAPKKVKKDDTITIQVDVNHDGNNFIHYVDWVYVKVNGKEIKRWEYTAFERPDTENFSVSITYTVEGPVEIEAMANCNLHGSDGKVIQKVTVTEE